MASEIATKTVPHANGPPSGLEETRDDVTLERLRKKLVLKELCVLGNIGLQLYRFCYLVGIFDVCNATVTPHLTALNLPMPN